jgi:solute carrier family 25 thiamine pyrophosphate transporter 19
MSLTDQPTTKGIIFGLSRDAVAGGIAGGAARLLTSPFDVLKIRFQLQSHETPKYKSMFHALNTIIKEEGVFALWKGNLSATYLYVAYAMVQFSMYNFFKTYLLVVNDPFKKNGESNELNCSDAANSSSWKALMLFTAGAGAGITATVSTYPFDIMRTQFAMQGQTKHFNSISSFLTGTYRTQGLRGFFTGMGPAVLGVAPYMGLNFALYESMNRYVESLTHNNNELLLDTDFTSSPTGSPLRQTVVSILQKGASGGVAGGLSKFLVFPLDTLKKRLQAQVLMNTISTSDLHTNAVPPRYSGMAHCVQCIYRNEGLLGFYKVCIISCLKYINR